MALKEVFDNYCINSDTIEEIIPKNISDNNFEIEIHFVSGKSRILTFESKDGLKRFFKTMCEK